MEEFNRVRPHAAHLPGNVPAYAIRIQDESRNQTAVLDADDVGAITCGHVTLHVQVFGSLSFEGRILQWDLSGRGGRRGQQRTGYQRGPYAYRSFILISFVLSSFTLASCQGGRRENRLWDIGRLSWVARAPQVGRSCVRSVADRTALYR